MGHSQGNQLQRNAVITNVVKDTFGAKMHCYQLKYCKKIYTV
jgi:hypothetical protein